MAAIPDRMHAIVTKALLAEILLQKSDVSVSLGHWKEPHVCTLWYEEQYCQRPYVIVIVPLPVWLLKHKIQVRFLALLLDHYRKVFDCEKN
jgi:hypothetical protein